MTSHAINPDAHVVPQAKGVAGAAPNEDVPHGLLGELQRLFPLSVADIFLPDP